MEKTTTVLYIPLFDGFKTPLLWILITSTSIFEMKNSMQLPV